MRERPALVHLILTRHGFEHLVDALLCVPSPLWVNRGVLAADELAAMRATGIDVTGFAHAIDPADPFQVAEAARTVAYRHPGRQVWIEHAASV